MREELFYQSRSQSFLLLMGTREAGLQGCYFHASLTYVLDKYCWRHMYHLVKKKIEIYRCVIYPRKYSYIYPSWSKTVKLVANVCKHDSYCI